MRASALRVATRVFSWLVTRHYREPVLGDLAENKFSIYHYAGSRLLGIESVNRPADHMLGRKMLGAGFSPTPQTVAGGPDALKAALAAFSESEPARAAG